MKLNSKNVLYFNIFINNEVLYIIAPLYKTVIIDHMKVIVNDENIICKKIVKNKYEATQILYAAIKKAKMYNIKIRYKSKVKLFTLTENIEKKNKLVLTTLFKDDYNLINNFYDYYVKQGVEYFYLYYNGKLNDKIREVCDKPNIKLIEWDFEYWNTDSKFSKHHAQIGQMHDAIYRYGKNYSDYMIFCDLDEYMYVKDKTLLQLIETNTNIESFGFCNKWSETIDKKIPEKFPNEFYTYPRIRFGSRSKCIHKIKNLEYISIHYGFQKKTLNNFDLFHFYNWTQKNRKINSGKKKLLKI